MVAAQSVEPPPMPEEIGKFLVRVISAPVFKLQNFLKASAAFMTELPFFGPRYLAKGPLIFNFNSQKNN